MNSTTQTTTVAIAHPFVDQIQGIVFPADWRATGPMGPDEFDLPGIEGKFVKGPQIRLEHTAPAPVVGVLWERVG